MEYAIKERIGKPDLFTGRKEELSFYLNWINDIKEEKSQSTAILARRYARPKSATDYAIIGEVKNRELKTFSREEAISFMTKFEGLKKLETLERVIPFVFSCSGFTKEAEAYCLEMGIASSRDERFLHN